MPAIMEVYRSGGTPWFVVIARDGRVVYDGFRLDAKSLVQTLRPLAARRSPLDKKGAWISGLPAPVTVCQLSGKSPHKPDCRASDPPQERTEYMVGPLPVRLPTLRSGPIASPDNMPGSGRRMSARRWKRMNGTGRRKTAWYFASLRNVGRCNPMISAAVGITATADPAA